MSSAEKNSFKNNGVLKGDIDNPLRPFATEFQNTPKQDKLLTDILNNSLSPEQRLASVKALVGNSGHLDVNVRDSQGQLHKLRLEVEKAGNSTEMLHVMELDGASGKTKVFLRGNQIADGSFHKQKDQDGKEVSFAPDKLGTVETFKANSSNADTKKLASAKIQGLAPEVSTNNLLGKVEISGGYKAVGTAYYPHDSLLEGGFKDKIGKPLRTLEDYLAGKADYVSVAMDNKAGFKYGQQLRIPELEQKYGKKIPFKIVDTGGAFFGKGTGRIDICVANEKASRNSVINGNLTLLFV